MGGRDEGVSGADEFVVGADILGPAGLFAEGMKMTGEPYEVAIDRFEVKAAATVIASDFRGLRKLKQAAAQRFVRGIVLYDGEATVPFGEGLYAVPLRCLWETEQ